MNVNVQCKLLYDKLIREKVNLVNNDNNSTSLQRIITNKIFEFQKQS